MGRGVLAQIYARTDRLDQAEELTLETIKKMETSRGKAHPDCVYGLWKLAQLYVLKGLHEEARQICELGLQRADMRITRRHPLAKQLGDLLSSLEAPGIELANTGKPRSGSRSADVAGKNPNSRLEKMLAHGRISESGRMATW